MGRSGASALQQAGLPYAAAVRGGGCVVSKTKVTLSVTRYSVMLPFSTTTLWLATQASLMFWSVDSPA